jgi:hypothetical protein
MDLVSWAFDKHYLTYKSEIVGSVAIKVGNNKNLQEISDWLKSESIPLRFCGCKQCAFVHTNAHLFPVSI